MERNSGYPHIRRGKPEKNPIFLEKRVYQGSSGVVYPYPVIESIANEKHDREWNAVFLENEYIKVMVLPELGGRVQMAYDKIKKRHFVYYNHVIKPALVGLAGPWISGGIEFNWPQHHRPSTYMPVDCTIEEHEDGSVTVWVSEMERMFHQKGMAGFTLPKNVSTIFPFNLDMGGALLKYATAQPLMIIDDNGTTHYFFSVHDGIVPEFVFDKGTVKGKSEFKNIVPGFKSTFKVSPRGKKAIKVTVLPYADALNATKVDGKLLITKATVVPTTDGVKLLSLGEPDIDYIVYPSKQGFKTQTASVEPVFPKATVDKSVPWRMEVTFTDRAADTPQVNEYFISVPYTGDVAMAFLDNAMVLDHFWQGMPWRIGLNRFASKMSDGKPLGFYFRPLRPEAQFLPDIPAERVPDLSGGPVLEIGDPTIIPEYVTTIKL